MEVGGLSMGTDEVPNEGNSEVLAVSGADCCCSQGAPLTTKPVPPPSKSPPVPFSS